MKTLAKAMWFILVACLWVSCGEDFSRLAVCPSGREAWVTAEELICYERDAPYASRDRLPDETRETACAYCDGFIR
jgi:hypothetical protein